MGYNDTCCRMKEQEADSLRERIADLEVALFLLAEDAEAMHRSHVPGPGEPPITKNERANLARAQALLVGVVVMDVH